jgi:tellurite resistance protein TerC
MLLHDFIHVPEWASLGFIALSLLVGIMVSLKFGKEKELTDLDLD